MTAIDWWALLVAALAGESAAALAPLPTGTGRVHRLRNDEITADDTAPEDKDTTA